MASLDSLAPEWVSLLREIPGYDPFATAGECWFDEAAAQKALDFFAECITHVEGALAGTPFVLERWQQSIVANLFGWKRRDSLGREVRRYREVFLYVPRKNGKTPLAAAIALYVFFCDNESGQQDYIAAADREQAGMLFRQAKGMVEGEPELSSRCRIYDGNAAAGQSRSIVRESDASFLRVISADADTKHGGNSHLVIVDELHAQPNRELVDVLQTSLASQNRKQPLFICITTADYDRPSICNEKYDQACKVRDNDGDPLKPGYDPAFLPVIYEASRDDDWTSPDVWAKANPNLGVSVSREYLEREVKTAKERPEYENTIRRLHLNIRTQSDVKWLDLGIWDSMAVAGLEKTLKGRKCFAGLDLSSTRDLTAFGMLFPPDDETPLWSLLTKIWIPEEAVERRTREDRVPYDAWVKAGWMKTTPGNATDYETIRSDIDELASEFAIHEIAVDRLFQGEETAHKLMGMGFEVIAFGQGFYSMAAPCKRFDELFYAKQMQHDGNPVMRWMVGNVMVETDAAGNKKPSKKKSAEKIDGVVTHIMALGRAMVSGDEKTTDVADMFHFLD